ncbi:MAG: gliding motility-associated C-terminal domain-containing protein [Vicingaceae bacterium]
MVDSIGILSLDTVIIDTSGWVKIEGIYLAEGGEQYLTIGNFNDDTNTSYHIFNNNATIPSSYYYIDDVSLVKISNPYDLAVSKITDTNPCYTGQDSLYVSLQNRGDTAIDFSKDTAGLTVEIRHQGNLHNSFSIELTNFGDSLAVDSSLQLLVAPVDFSNYNQQYSIRASLNFGKDRNQNNNVLDTLLQTELSVGEISLSSNVLCTGSELSLSSKNYKGEPYWEYSNNSVDWELLTQGANAKHQVDSTTYYRLRICADLYSDTFQLNVVQPQLLADQNFNPCVKGKYIIEIETPAAVQNLNWYAALSDSEAFHQGMTYETTIKSDQLYYLTTVIDSCESAERTLISVKLGGCPLYIPNAFSPNGDGLNDVFRYANAEGHEEIKTVIYNRWGNKVAEWSGNAGWDGGNHPVGSYKYIVKTAEDEYVGSLLLVR